MSKPESVPPEHACPKCGFVMQASWLRCPRCHVSLAVPPEQKPERKLPTIEEMSGSIPGELLDYESHGMKRPVPSEQWMVNVGKKAVTSAYSRSAAEITAILAEEYAPVAAAHAQRIEELTDGIVEHQKHRDAWRGYAYGIRDKPQDFLDGNMVDRPPTFLEVNAIKLSAAESALTAAKARIEELELLVSGTTFITPEANSEAVRRLCEAIQLAVNCNSCRPCSESLGAALAEVEAAGKGE